MVFDFAFNFISVVSQRQLGFRSVFPKDTRMKTTDDPVRLEPRTPRLRITYTTEPHFDLDKSGIIVNDAGFITTASVPIHACPCLFTSIWKYSFQATDRFLMSEKEIRISLPNGYNQCSIRNWPNWKIEPATS